MYKPTKFFLFISVIFALFACTPLSKTQQPNVTQTQTQFYSTTTPEKHSNFPTKTPYHPTPNPPLDNEIFIPRVSISETTNQSQEEIVKTLALQWLEYYKTQEKSNDYKIEDYNINNIRLEKNNNPDYHIIATLTFEVKPMQLQSAWIVGAGTAIDNGWIRTGRTFGVFQDGEYFKLKDLPGWGT